MRKILSVVLVLSLVLGSMSMAFAAPQFSDVENKDVLDAVKRLSAFGIVNGYEDGTYQPEKDVTRAEFAKLLVVALGLENAADAAMGTTRFSDVTGDEWFAGYVNVAVGQGVLKGYPDGTFGPNKKVKYSEAVTMLVRALGYKDEFLAGSWPGNYLAKAASLDITDNVQVVSSGFANRGASAVMLNNTLDAKTIVQDSYGDDNNWTESDTTLLEDKLEVSKIEDAVVTATPKVDSGIDEDQITFDDGTYDVTIEGLNIDTLLGLSLNIYLNDDDEVVYVEESDENYKTVYDVIDADEDVLEDSITLVNVDKEYEFADDSKVYLDNKELSVSDLETEVADGDVVFGKFVLDNKGNIAAADLQQFDGDQARIVKSVDGEEIIYNVTDADDEKSLDLADDDYDAYVIMDAQGNIMSAEDIQKDDIIYVNEKDVNGDDLEIASSGDTVVYVVVVRDTIEGSAQSYDGDEIEINDDTYDWTSHATATVSIDNDDEYVMVADDLDELNDITDQEANVVALKDLVGDIRHIRTDVESSSDELYGVITAKDTNFSDTVVKILNYDEDEVEYEFDLDDIYGYGAGADENDVAIGDIVKYTLNSDGEIDTISLVGTVDLTAADVAGSITGPAADTDLTVADSAISDDFGKETVEINGTDYIVEDDVVIMDLTAAVDGSSVDYADAEFVDYAGLVDKSGENTVAIYALDENNAVVFMAFVDDFDANDDEQAGYIVDTRKKDGDYLVEMVLPGSNDTVKYTVDEYVYAPTDESVAVFEIGSDGDIDLLETPSSDYKTITGMVSDVSGKFVTITDDAGNSLGTYKVDSDCVYYQEDDEASLSDLDENQTMVTLVIKDAMVEVAKIYDIDTEDLDYSQDSQNQAFVEAYQADNGAAPANLDVYDGFEE